MTKYLVETVAIFRHRYVVEAQEESHALDEVVMNTEGDYNDDWREFSQKFISEDIISSRPLTEEEYLAIFDNDNTYLKSWTKDQKLEFINVIKYED
jgi:hypothetical protein